MMGRDTPWSLAQCRAAEAEGGVCRDQYCDLSTVEGLYEHRQELGKPVLHHTEDCCDTSRDRGKSRAELPAQTAGEGGAELHSTLPGPGSCSPVQAAALCGLCLSWVLTVSGDCTTSRGALGPLPALVPISLGQARKIFPCLCCSQHLTVDPQLTGQAQTMGTCHRSLLAGQRPVCLFSPTQAPQLMQTLQPHQPAEKATHSLSWAPLGKSTQHSVQQVTGRAAAADRQALIQPCLMAKARKPLLLKKGC